jgi:DNA-damage-inducible protein J
MTTINIRIEDATKKKAIKTLAGLGMDMSTAIKIFLNQVIIEDGLPFTPSAKRRAIRAKWDKEVAEALKGKGFKTVEEATRYALRNKLH